MSKYLREETVLVPAMRKEMVLVQLNHAAQAKMMECQKRLDALGNPDPDIMGAMLWAVKYGTREFQDVSTEEISQSLSFGQVQGIAEAVAEMSEYDANELEKNSESGLSDVSSSA